MPRQLALFICILFILWLFARDRKLRPMASGALWVALLWIVIIGSRPISVWFGGGLLVVTPDDYLEGSPLDRNVYLILMVIGLVVLWSRGVNWGRIFSSNRWLFAFFVYWGLSLIWSDYPFVGFKRWIKDLGNVIMVLVILTEKDPEQATRALFARFTYLVIPLSVVFIKYFAELGRYLYHRTWEAGYSGVTIEKNGLGSLVFICGLFWVWDLIEMRSTGGRKTDKADLLGRVVLLLMMIWIMGKANSLTAVVCLILGVAILLFMRYPFARKRTRFLGTYSLALGFLIFLLYSTPGIRESFVGTVGRDMTLTGRTDLWADLLREPINPLLGKGYQTFWLGPTAERYWEKYSFHPNQAHNGYLETYLNGGLIGVCLLIAMIISAGRNLKKQLLLGSSFAMLRFSFLVVIVFYNWTEAMFNKIGPVWFILLLVAPALLRPFEVKSIRAYPEARVQADIAS